MAPAQYAPLGQLLGLFVMASFWGTISVLQMLWTIIRYGPRKYFYMKRRESRPEILDDPDLGTHHFARLKNIRLHYVSKGDEGKPLVLFLHGFPEFWYSWRYQLREFGQDYRAVAIDMRGYGESEKPEGTAEYRMEKLTEDVRDFIQYLGYKKCYLVAHDWGGGVAWTFATQYPDMVDRLVVCNIPNPYAFQKYLQKHFSQLLKSWYMFFFQWPCLPELILGSNDLEFLKVSFTSKAHGVKPRNMTNEDMDAFLYSFKNCADRTGPINYYRAVMRYKPQRLPSNKVKCPTMIIWGTRDAFLEREMAELSKQYVDNECVVCYVEGASHWVQQDDPEIVNKYMRDFLSGNKSKEAKK